MEQGETDMKFSVIAFAVLFSFSMLISAGCSPWILYVDHLEGMSEPGNYIQVEAEGREPTIKEQETANFLAQHMAVKRANRKLLEKVREIAREGGIVIDDKRVLLWLDRYGRNIRPESGPQKNGGWFVLRRIRINGDHSDSLNKFLGVDWIRVKGVSTAGR